MVLGLCRISRGWWDTGGITGIIEMWHWCLLGGVKVNSWYTPSQCMQRSPHFWQEALLRNRKSPVSRQLMKFTFDTWKTYIFPLSLSTCNSPHSHLLSSVYGALVLQGTPIPVVCFKTCVLNSKWFYRSWLTGFKWEGNTSHPHGWWRTREKYTTHWQFTPKKLVLLAAASSNGFPAFLHRFWRQLTV